MSVTSTVEWAPVAPSARPVVTVTEKIAAPEDSGDGEAAPRPADSVERHRLTAQ